jgi:hypothetical protein
VIRYTPLRPFVLHVNHTGARLAAALRAGPPPKDESKGDESKGDEARGEPNGEPSTEPAQAAQPSDVPSSVVPSSDAVVGGSTD